MTNRDVPRQGEEMPGSVAGLFPHSPRVFYAKAPLIEVVAQLRFPPILRIHDQPAEFQERIRRNFPLFENVPLLGLPQGIELPQALLQTFGNPGLPVGYRFATEDRLAFITLFSESIAYTTHKYTVWEEFQEITTTMVAALAEIYNPSFFSRIGLRYIDAISRSDLNIENVPWSKLLRPEIAGELMLPEFENNVKSSGKRIHITLGNDLGEMQIQHGINSSLPNRVGTFYMIDFDFFGPQKTEVTDAGKKLDHFHDFAGRAFRWCILDELHNALEPRPIDERG